MSVATCSISEIHLKKLERGEINMAKDPVCGMEVDQSTEYRTDHNGKTYYFCSSNCKTTFNKNPNKYVKI
jgi:YHS domain-containing protein